MQFFVQQVSCSSNYLEVEVFRIQDIVFFNFCDVGSITTEWNWMIFLEVANDGWHCLNG